MREVYLHVYHFMDRSGETVHLANNVNQLMGILGFTNVRDCTMLLAEPYFAADFFAGLATGVGDPIYMIDPYKVLQHWEIGTHLVTHFDVARQANHYFIKAQSSLIDNPNTQVGSW